MKKICWYCHMEFEGRKNSRCCSRWCADQLQLSRASEAVQVRRGRKMSRNMAAIAAIARAAKEAGTSYGKQVGREYAENTRRKKG